MKVLIINSVCGIGSTGRICTDLAESLRAQGHDCRIVYGRDPLPQKFSDIAHKVGGRFDAKIHAAVSRVFDNSGFGSVKATKRLIDYISDYDPDVIHLHNLHGHYINVEILFDYIKLSGKKVIWTLHDCWAFTGHCAYYTLTNCDKWQDGCKHCEHKWRYPASYVANRAAKNYEKKKKIFCGVADLTLVTPSRWLATEVSRSFLKDYPIKVVPNGIDTGIFKPTASNFKERYGIEGKKMILGVSNIWERRKGYEDFLKLSQIISEDEVIVLVGSGGKAVENMPKNVIAIERTHDTKELAEIYSCADVFVNPTHEDNYPTVNLEARACGTPVVSYDVGGVAETVKDGGRIVPCGDFSKLYDEIKDILRSPERYSVDGADEFDKTNMLKEYLGLYR